MLNRWNFLKTGFYEGIRLNGGSLIIVAGLLLLTGLVLRWELVDWLMDAVGFMFIAGGVMVGIAGLLSLLSGRKHSSSAY